MGRNVFSLYNVTKPTICYLISDIQKYIRDQVTDCGFCHIIQGKDVPQKYISMKFDIRHQKVGDRPIFPNTCLSWMMLTISEREKVLEYNELYCKFCLRLLRAGRGGNSCGQGRS